MEGAAKWRGGVYLLVCAAVYGPPLGALAAAARNNMEAVPKLQRRRSACALLFSGDSTAGLEIDVKPYRLAQRCSSVFAADR